MRKHIANILYWFTSGPQIILLMAITPVAPITVIFLVAKYPALTTIIFLAATFGFLCVSRSQWKRG